MPALTAGQQLEGTVYTVVRELGAGGMGVVYEVEHVRLKKRYVAKIIHDLVRGDDGAQKRMEREARVLAEISHPNIVQVHDVGTMLDGTSYFVMEKLEGMDLRTAIKRGGLSRVRSLQIAIDILDALTHVHARGIVHRDIKPANIFLAKVPNGTITKVLDFGIVHIFDGTGIGSQARITKTGGFVGTLYYSAPEQMQGKPASPPNDVYAAALVLFELIAGRGPFDDDPGVGLSRCFKPAPRIDTVVPSASPELTNTLAAALEQDPANRPTAGAFAARLREIFAIESTSPGAGERAALEAEVDDLLQNMPLQSDPAIATVTSLSTTPVTHAPATPLMAGAPPHAASPAPPPSERSFATAPTIASPNPPKLTLKLATASAVTSPSHPQGDTAPGVYATVDPRSSAAPRRNAFQLVSTVVAIIVLLAIGVGGATTIIVRGRAAPPVEETRTAPAAEPATAVPVPVVIPTPPPSEAVAEPLPTTTASAEPVVSATAPSATATSKPAPRPASGRAKKEGYVETL